jgi:hypothetical protein
MYLRIIDSNPVEYNLARLRKAYPNTSFPKEPPLDLLASYDIYPYTVDPAPSFDSLTEGLEAYFEEDQGVWYRRWNVVPLTLDAEQQENVDTLKDAAISAIITSTNAQIDTYIDNNVTSLAEAQTFLKKLTKVVRMLAKGSFQGI